MPLVVVIVTGSPTVKVVMVGLLLVVRYTSR